MLFVWDYEFRHPPEAVWSLVADTDRLYRAVGMPPVEFTHRPDHRGGTLRFGRFRLFGVLMAWQEHPYEWIRNRFFQVERTFDAGPLDSLRMQWRLFQNENGCRLQTSIQARANKFWRTPAGLLIQFYFRWRYKRVYRRLARFLDGRTPLPYSVDKAERPVTGRLLAERLAARFESAGVTETLAAPLARYLLTGPYREVTRMRPNELARMWNQPPDLVYRSLLILARRLFLRLTFELICPDCRRVLERTRHLRAVPVRGYCQDCNRTSHPHLVDTVRLSFAPNPSLRRARLRSYCRGGPFLTPHFEAQLILSPDADRAIELLLSAGEYRLRSLHSQREFSIKVSDRSGTIDRPLCSFPRPDRNSKAPVIPEFGSGRVGLFLRNEMHLDILTILESSEPGPDELPALTAVCDPVFLEFYADEFPTPSAELPAGRMAFLFAGDLAAGEIDADRRAALAEIAAERRGLVLPSETRGVLFAFAEPAAATKTALALHERKVDADLRVGLHAGPACAVNREDRLEFSGPGRELALVAGEHGAGGDVVFTAPILKDPGVRAVLMEAGIVRFSRSEYQGPEFERPLPLFRHLYRTGPRISPDEVPADEVSGPRSS